MPSIKTYDSMKTLALSEGKLMKNSTLVMLNILKS